MKREKISVLKVYKFILYIQLMLMCIFNLFFIQGHVNFDSSTFLLGAIKMWEQKSFLLKEFAYATGLFIDSPVPLAAILYGITNNIFVAYGISTIIITFSCLWVLRYILNQLEISIEAKYMVGILMLLPYSTGMLGYVPVSFWGEGYYNIKILILLLSIGIFLHLYNEDKKKYPLAGVILLNLLYFISGFSSGLYILQCVILPLLAYEIIILILKDDIKSLRSKRVITLGIGIGSSLGGVILAKLLKVNQYAAGMKLNYLENFLDNMKGYILGIFDLFGGIPWDNDISVISISGVGYMARFIFVIIMLGAFIYFTTQVKTSYSNKYATNMILCIFFINAIILLLANTKTGSVFFEARYHLVPITGGFILVGLVYDKIVMLNKKILTYLIIVAFIGATLLTDASRYKELFTSSNSIKSVKKLQESLEQFDSGLVIWLGTGQNEARMMSVLDLDRKHIYTEDGRHADQWGNSIEGYDNSQYADNVIILSTEECIEKQPDYIKNNLNYSGKYQDEVLNIEIYKMEQNKFDFTVDMPDKGMMIDFPYSRNYDYYRGEFNGEGAFVSKGEKGVIIEGTKKAKPGVYDITLDYVIKAASDKKVGEFKVSIDGQEEQLATTYIDSNTNRVKLEKVEIVEEDSSIICSVEVEEGTIIEINHLEFERK